MSTYHLEKCLGCHANLNASSVRQSVRIIDSVIYANAIGPRVYPITHRSCLK